MFNEFVKIWIGWIVLPLSFADFSLSCPNKFIMVRAEGRFVGWDVLCRDVNIIAKMAPNEEKCSICG